MLKGKKIGVIGGGFMAEALLQGFSDSGICDMGMVTVSDVRQERLDYLKERYGVKTGTENGAAVAGAEIVILAVKPQVIEEVLAETGRKVESGAITISIAAGVKISTIASHVSGKIIRAMPNTCAQVGEGMTALCANPQAGMEDVEAARALFGAVGDTIVLEEEKMDAVTAVSGSGPAYIYLVMEALMEAGVACGLPADYSRRLVVQTVKGAGAMAGELEDHPAVLRQRITSPAGTTAEALAVLEKGGVRGTFIEAVKAAFRRSKELG